MSIFIIAIFCIFEKSARFVPCTAGRAPPGDRPGDQKTEGKDDCVSSRSQKTHSAWNG